MLLLFAFRFFYNDHIISYNYNNYFLVVNRRRPQTAVKGSSTMNNFEINIATTFEHIS